MLDHLSNCFCDKVSQTASISSVCVLCNTSHLHKAKYHNHYSVSHFRLFCFDTMCTYLHNKFLYTAYSRHMQYYQLTACMTDISRHRTTILCWYIVTTATEDTSVNHQSLQSNLHTTIKLCFQHIMYQQISNKQKRYSKLPTSIKCENKQY